MEEAPGYTGEVSRMQESHGEDRASHTAPESCTEGVSALLICSPLWMSEGKRSTHVIVSNDDYPSSTLSSKTTVMHDLVVGLFINRYEFGRLI